jgi:gliding motility-associated-like protein
MLACCSVIQVSGQLTARDTDGKEPTRYTNAYGNRDTIFVFNLPMMGNLSLRQPGQNTFKWYQFNDKTLNFDKIDEVTDAAETSKNAMAQGGYKVTVTPRGATAPRDSFMAWLYLNPGFEFGLLKNQNGEIPETYSYRQCTHTDFVFNPKTPTKQSSFTYYNPGNLQQGALRFDNEITFMMKPEDGTEVKLRLNTQGNDQYLRDNSPPYEDTRYFFRVYDMFGIEREDDIMYRTIIPFVKLDQPVLPEKDPTSAPLPVKFTWKPYNVSEYEWQFGDGTNEVYGFDQPAPDTVMHVYYTPRTQGYLVELKVTSLLRCTFTTEPYRITVDPPLLEVPNVFTPNFDGQNDYFKPNAVSLRRFEIWIYTRAGKQVYYHKGDDLRYWEGWDGRIEKSGNEAAEGVYFYIIKAMGWDEPSTKNPRPGPYSGSFHLYR